MRLLAPFGSVKTRFLALMVFVIVPVAVLTVALATATGESFSNDMKRAWRQSTDDYVIRARLWLRGTARTLNAAATAAGEGGGDCSKLLGDMAAVIEGYQAIEVRFEGGQTCSGGRNADLVDAVGKASAELSEKPRVEFSQAQQGALGVFVSGVRLLAVQIESPPSSVRKWAATALIDAMPLDRLFTPRPGPNDAVALMERGENVIFANGLDPVDTGWLPQAETVSEAYAPGEARSRSGSTMSYATQAVLGPQYYILRRFDTSARRAAWLRFLILAVAPLATLAALCLLYSWAIQSEVLRWIDSIKLAILARRRGQGAKPLAPMDAGMPTELRDFAAIFNDMARESAIREDSLKRSVAENEFLLRELHHRVKNSLQIIQSYLSLTRRLDSVSAESEALAAMEARVQVLAVAYRKAFAEGRMRDLRVRMFAEELTRNLSQSFRRPGLALELEAEVTTALVIDRAIPMGLALVEAVMAGLRAPGARWVRILIVERERRQLELRVWTDGTLTKNKPNDRLMTGLAQQLGATIEEREAGVILHWCFQGGPPPALPSSGPTNVRADDAVVASRAPGAG